MFERLLTWIRRQARLVTLGSPRVTGRPTSATGASSFHLWWDLPELPLRELAATLTILTPPSVDELYFFAVQASFIRRTEPFGGAHLGLQWNPRHPANRAVNWGGYDELGAILRGTRSGLPSTPNDPNTRDYPWQPGRSYRLAIGPATASPEGQIAWPGTITDLRTGEATVVRELLTGGDALRAPVMWMEVFAACDDPTVVIQWSDLQAVTTDGTVLRPQRCRTAYQGHRAGGCANTSSGASAEGFVQRTATERLTPPDTFVSLR